MTDGRVIVVLGPAGSGKSTVAQRIAASRQAVYLDKDAMLAEIVEATMRAAGQDPDERESNAFYREHVLPLEYRALWRVAAANVGSGLDVVIDAPFLAYISDEGYLERALAEAESSDTDVVVARVVTPAHEVRARLVQRGRPRDRWKLENWSQFWTLHGDARCAWRGADQVEIGNADSDPDLTALEAILAVSS